MYILIFRYVYNLNSYRYFFYILDFECLILYFCYVTNYIDNVFVVSISNENNYFKNFSRDISHQFQIDMKSKSCRPEIDVICMNISSQAYTLVS